MSLLKKLLSSNLSKYEDEQKRRYKKYMKISKKQAKILEKSEAEVYEDYLERQKSLRASKRKAPVHPNEVIFKEPSEGLSLGPAPAVLEASNRYVIVEGVSKEHLTELEKLHLPNYKETTNEPPNVPKEVVYENTKKDVIPNGNIPQDSPAVPKRKKWKRLSQDSRHSAEPEQIYQNLFTEHRKSFTIEETNTHNIYNGNDIILRDNIGREDSRATSSQSEVFYDCETPISEESKNLESFHSVIDGKGDNTSNPRDFVDVQRDQPIIVADSTSKQVSEVQEETPALVFVSRRRNSTSSSSSSCSASSEETKDDQDDIFISSSDEADTKEELMQSFNKYVMKPRPQEDAPSTSSNHSKQETRIHEDEGDKDDVFYDDVGNNKEVTDRLLLTNNLGDEKENCEEEMFKQEEIKVKFDEKRQDEKPIREEDSQGDNSKSIDEASRSNSFKITKERIKFDDDEEETGDEEISQETHKKEFDITQETPKVIYLKDFRKKSDEPESSDTTDEEGTILDGNIQFLRRLSNDIDGMKHYEHKTEEGSSSEEDVFEPKKTGKRKVYFDFANSYCTTYDPITEDSATSETSTTDDEENYVTFSFDGYDNDSYVEFLKTRSGQIDKDGYHGKDQICKNFGVGSTDLKSVERQKSVDDKSMDVVVLNCKNGYDQSKANQDFSENTEEELDQFSDDCSLDFDVPNQNKFQNYYDNIGDFNGETSKDEEDTHEEFNIADIQADLDEIKKLDDVVTQIDKIQDILSKITVQVECLESKDNDNYTGLLKTLLGSMKILGGLDCHFDEELLEFQQKTLSNIRGCIDILKDK